MSIVIIIFLILFVYFMMFFTISSDVKYKEVYKNKILKGIDNSIDAKKIKLSDIRRNIKSTKIEMSRYKLLDS